MTACSRLSDRMVAVASGLATWSAEEAEHLAGCPECGAEWRVARAGRALGDSLPPPDLGRLVRGVRARLTSEPAAPRAVTPIGGRRAGWRWVAVVAAAAVVVMAIRLGGRRTTIDATAEPVGVLTELEELSPSELETVLTELEVAGSRDDGSLGDLDADELEQVLHSWES